MEEKKEKEKEKVKFSYETLWKFIIRPPRDDYTENMLGEPSFYYKGKIYKRKDYEIKSSQGYKLKCSFIEPSPESRPSKKMPVLLYLHGNSSSRIEGINIAPILLKKNINLFTFDFAGCGQSEGEYISLGYHESHDVKIIIDFIEKIPGTGKIGLWGRSMGAATAMIYAHRDKRIKAICMDSPFADFLKLAKELTLKQISLPGFLISIALSIVRKTVLNKNGLDIDKLKPIDQAKKTFQPAMFIHAINDELINIEHSNELFKEYAGDKKTYKTCPIGGHNSRRPNEVIKEIQNFFSEHLLENDNNNLNEKKIHKKLSNKEKDFDKFDKNINKAKIRPMSLDKKKIKNEINEEEENLFNNKNFEYINRKKKIMKKI